MAKKDLETRIWFFSLVNEENDIEKIKENLRNSKASLVFTICHDKDRILQDDGTSAPKKLHTHFAIRYENPTKLSTIANLCCLDPENWNLIQKAKNWKSSCRYMLHLDQREKHLYDVKELEAIKGTREDYYNIAMGKAQLVTSDADLFPWFGKFEEKTYSEQYQLVYDGLDDGKRRNSLIRELKEEYENYLEFRRHQMETKNVKVIFVEGPAGSGKSTFAVNSAVSQNKSYVVSSSNNDLLQDYTCQDYLILDDLRDTSLEFNDLLKLLDNFVISSVKSRYKNKLFLGETIIITSTIPLSDWYKDINEDKTQLYRRINGYVKCHRINDLLFSDVYIPSDDEKPVNNQGMPNGKVVTMPIMIIDKKVITKGEELFKSLGLDFSVAMPKTLDGQMSLLNDFSEALINKEKGFMPVPDADPDQDGINPFNYK